MKEKALIELTARQAQIVASLLPTVPLPPAANLSAAASIMKLKLEVDEILGEIQKAFGNEPLPVAEAESKPKRKRH